MASSVACCLVGFFILFATQHLILTYAPPQTCPDYVSASPRTGSMSESQSGEYTPPQPRHHSPELSKLLEKYSGDVAALKRDILARVTARTQAEFSTSIQNVAETTKALLEEDEGDQIVFTNNNILHFQDESQGARYSSVFCLRGEPQECWFGDKFRNLDWSVRHCFFRNLGIELDGTFTFYQNPNYLPVWDFNFGKVQLSIDTVALKEAYGIHVRIVNQSLPTAVNGGVDNCTIFAHPWTVPGRGDYQNRTSEMKSVLATFEAMANANMFSMENSAVILPANHIEEPKSRWWNALFKQIRPFSEFVEQSGGTVLPLALFGPRAAFPGFSNEIIGQVMRDRAFALYGIQNGPVTSIRPRLGIVVSPGDVLHGFVNGEEAKIALENKLGKGRCVIELIRPDSRMREILTNIASYDVLITPSGFQQAFPSLFVKEGATVVYIPLFLKGIQGKPFECLSGPGDHVWSMFPYFHRVFLDVIAADDQSEGRPNWFVSQVAVEAGFHLQLQVDYSKLSHLVDQALSRLGK